MQIASLLEPMAACPFCERTGMLGYEREVVGGKAVVVFKCHDCQRVWEMSSDTPPVVRMRER
jgi:transposase-like protein